MTDDSGRPAQVVRVYIGPDHPLVQISLQLTQIVSEDIDSHRFNYASITCSNGFQIDVLPDRSQQNFGRIGRGKTRQYLRTPPETLTGLAVFIAGRRRAALREEWRAHLSGEEGSELPEGRQVREAAGFLLAAARYRLQDVADILWLPVDAVLGSRELSGLVVLVPAFGVAVLFLRHGGLRELADNLDSVGVVWGATCGLIRLGRWWRGVQPPKHEPRRKAGGD